MKMALTHASAVSNGLSGRLLGLTLGLSLPFATPAIAAEKLYFAGFGGVIEDVFRKEILPPFEKAHDVQVEYLPATSAMLLSKLRAQKDNPEIDLVQMDSGPQQQAIDLDLCSPITDKRILDQTIKRWADDKAITWSIVSAGMVYNKRYFDKQGWPAPTSWNDLRDPKFKKKIMMPTFATAFGLYALVMLARANGGSEKDIESGFAIMGKEVGPNVVSFDPGPGKSAELYQTEQAVIGVWSMPRVVPLQEAGFPLQFVFPKEGAIASPEHACLVKKPKPNPLAQELLAHVMSEPVQQILAKSLGMTPGRKDIVLPPDVAANVPLADVAAKMLVDLDYDTINEKHDDWFKRWRREVER